MPSVKLKAFDENLFGPGWKYEVYNIFRPPDMTDEKFIEYFQTHREDYTMILEQTSDYKAKVYKHEQCNPCPMGTYSDEIGLVESNQCKGCPLGKYGNKKGLFDVDDCRSCPWGKYTDADTDNDSQDDCKTCPEGRYVNKQEYYCQGAPHITNSKQCRNIKWGGSFCEGNPSLGLKGSAFENYSYSDRSFSTPENCFGGWGEGHNLEIEGIKTTNDTGWCEYIGHHTTKEVCENNNFTWIGPYYSEKKYLGMDTVTKEDNNAHCWGAPWKLSLIHI